MSVPNAILGMIRAAVPAVTVFDSQVPDPDNDPVPERYAVFYPDDGTRDIGDEDTKVGLESTGEQFMFQVSSVAPDRQMAAWIARAIRDAITDDFPEVEGFSCGPIQHTLSATPDSEEQVLAKRSVLMVDRYELLADRLGETGS